MAFPVVQVSRPASLTGQSNGRLSPLILTSIPGQAGGFPIVLVTPAARSARAMIAEARKAGHVLKPSGPTDSYRPYAVQERIFRERYVPYFTRHTSGVVRRVWWNGRWWYHRSGAVAARPGTSNHGWALAIDLGEENDGDSGTERLDDATLAWLLANERRFGFSHEIQSERWHVRYWAGDTIPPAVLAYEKGLKPTRPTPPRVEEDDDMVTFVWFKDDRPAKGDFKPIPGRHLYAVTHGKTAQGKPMLIGGSAVHQTGDSWDVAKFLSGGTLKTMNTGESAVGRTWWSGIEMIDGPLAGI